jgi:hypothetical protein
MQIAINGQSAQSIGDDFSGQQGMSSDIDAALDAASSVMEATAIDATGFAFARAASGANTRPAIKKTASSRQRWIERFTPAILHNPAHVGSQVPSRKRGFR